MPNTTNYNWDIPADTDLVKDGAAAMRTLGNSIDTTTKNLNPETTLGDISYRSATANTNTRLPIGTNGQILTVVGGVPAWSSESGDISEVVAGTGISGGGTSGSVTVTNSMATTIDAKGDLIVGTGDNAFARLGVGTNGHTIVADSSTATGLKWAAAGGGGKILQVVGANTNTIVTNATTTLTDTGLTATITPSATSSKIIILVSQPYFKSAGHAQNAANVQLQRNGTNICDFSLLGYTNTTVIGYMMFAASYLDSPNTTSALTYKTQFANYVAQSAVHVHEGGRGSIVLMEVGA